MKDLKSIFNLKAFSKDKIIILIIAGIVLIITSYPFNKKREDNNIVTTQKEESSEDVADYKNQLENQLEEIISNIDGAGRVKIMISMYDSWEKIVKEDKEYKKSESNEVDSSGVTKQNSEIDYKSNSVLSGNQSGQNTPYIVKKILPTIKGAAIITDGGNNPLVVNAIKDVVKSILGIEVNKISVIKMKK